MSSTIPYKRYFEESTVLALEVRIKQLEEWVAQISTREYFLQSQLDEALAENEQTKAVLKESKERAERQDTEMEVTKGKLREAEAQVED
jgi:hypothetical protein